METHSKIQPLGVRVTVKMTVLCLCIAICVKLIIIIAIMNDICFINCLLPLTMCYSKICDVKKFIN